MHLIPVESVDDLVEMTLEFSLVLGSLSVKERKVIEDYILIVLTDVMGYIASVMRGNLCELLADDPRWLRLGTALAKPGPIAVAVDFPLYTLGFHVLRDPSRIVLHGLERRQAS